MRKKLLFAVGLSLLTLIFSASCNFNSIQQNTFAKNSTQVTKSSGYSKEIESPLVGNVYSNICKIFQQKPTWLQSALKAQKRWRTPIHVMMTIMKQESTFNAKARPPKRVRTNLFGKKILPSSAYGYAQAQNGTWKDYQKHTKNFHHRRDVFDHAINFIGWYTAQARKTLKLKSYDSYNLYLSYHEGLTGFRLNTHTKKPWLGKVAKKVQNYGYRYAKQLKNCSSELKQNSSNSAKLLLADNQFHAAEKKSSNGQKHAQKKSSIFNSPQQGCTKILGIWPFCKPFQR